MTRRRPTPAYTPYSLAAWLSGAVAALILLCAASLSAAAHPIQTAPCHVGESGPACQARLGDGWEVIYSPATGVLRGERREAGGYDAHTRPFSASRQQAGGVVNINTATPAQLALLPHVGPVLAGRIIAARPFAVRDDGKLLLSVQLSRVKGIGHGKRLASLLPHATVTGPTTATAKLGGGK